MSRLLAALLGLTLLSTAVWAEEEEATEEPEPTDVLILTDENFSKEIMRDIILVEFFAPWCGHCKKLKPEFETAATALLKNDPPVALATVDATEYKNLGNKAGGVSGFPTLKIFREGEWEEYEGPRDSDGIIEYMKKQAGRPSVRLNNTADVKLFVEDEGKTDPVLFGAFPTEDPVYFKTFKKVAYFLRGKAKVSHSTAVSVLEKFDYFGKKGLIQAYVPWSKKPIKFNKWKSFSKDTLRDWAVETLIPVFGELTKRNDELYKVTMKPTLKVLFKSGASDKTKDSVKKVMEEIAKADEAKPYYVVWAELETFSAEFSTFNTDLDYITVLDAKPENYYQFKDGELTVAKGKQFLVDHKDGKLDPHFKSEPLPEASKHEPGFVQELVAANFKEAVLESDKDVFIEFYAPWCGHCKKLTPTWEALAEELKDEPDIVIAKFNAVDNDMVYANKGYSARGYPTLKFAPASKKDSPVSFDSGDRDLETLKQFVYKHADKAKNPPPAKEEEKKDEL